MSVPLKLWEFLMSILPTPLKCTPLLLMPNCSLLSLFRHYLNWVRAIKRKSTNQPLQSFVFIKHKGAQTKTYSGCKWSKCQLEKKSSLGLLLKLTVPLNHLNHCWCSPLKGSRFFSFLSVLVVRHISLWTLTEWFWRYYIHEGFQ